MRKTIIPLFLVILTITSLLFTGCSKQILPQQVIENKLTEIITDAQINEIKFVQEKETSAYYEGKMSNSYADYYFKLDAFTGKTLDWKRTIKYLNETEFTNQMMAKYGDIEMADVKLVIEEDNSRYYSGILRNDISYYTFKIDAFDINNIATWEDVTYKYVEKKDEGKDEKNVSFCGEHTVRMNIISIFDNVLLNSCDLTKNEDDEYIYSGQFATELDVYTFTANAYTGELIEYTSKNQ